MTDYIITNLKEIIDFRNTINVHQDIESIINKIKIKKTSAKKEQDIENIISKLLEYIFDDIKTQYKVGGYWGAKIDIDINNGNYGIELKLAKSLISGSTEIFRLIGQVIYYKKRFYNNNLIVAIAGTQTELSSPIINELFDILNDLNTNFTTIELI